MDILRSVRGSSDGKTEKKMDIAAFSKAVGSERRNLTVRATRAIEDACLMIFTTDSSVKDADTASSLRVAVDAVLECSMVDYAAQLTMMAEDFETMYRGAARKLHADWAQSELDVLL